jgi:hypothetical protein
LRLPASPPLHLTYCTNIHAADGWPAVFANVRRYGPALKKRFSPGAPFGSGFGCPRGTPRNCSTATSRSSRRFWTTRACTSPIINGFPYGAFHRTPVKAEVYAPTGAIRSASSTPST